MSGKQADNKRKKRKAERVLNAFLYEENVNALATLSSQEAEKDYLSELYENHPDESSISFRNQSCDATGSQYFMDLVFEEKIQIVEHCESDLSSCQSPEAKTPSVQEVTASFSNGDCNDFQLGGKKTGKFDVQTNKNFCIIKEDISPELLNIISGEKEKSSTEKFQTNLTVWAQKYFIQRNALDDLLHMLCEHGHGELPACAKTLLNTPRSTVDLVKYVAGGQFWYYGVLKGMMTRLSDDYLNARETDKVEIQIFIDGVSPHKSVKRHLWPIAGCLKDSESPFIIALWFGESKELKSVDDFLQDFITEARELLKSGFEFKGRILKFTIEMFIADAPARAWIKKVKQHNSYNSCERCTLPGEWKFGRMTYNPAHEGTLRTDESFKNQIHREYHEGQSTLVLLLDIKMISQFPLDIMHLVYLGVNKRLFTLLVTKKKGQFKLSADEIQQLDKLCVFLSRFCPSDFARKPRPLSQIKLFKATEFRRMLLYDGFILQKAHKHKEVNKCFRILACAIRILLDSTLRTKFIDDAHGLLKAFVSECYSSLGASFVVYNVHHLLHLVADCILHGNPEKFSAFKFESSLGQIKNFLSAPGRSLQQIMCRMIERSLTDESAPRASAASQFWAPHSKGPVLNCGGQQFAAAKLLNSVIRTNGKDSFVLSHTGQIIVIENILKSSTNTCLIGRSFLEKSDYFQHPMPSSLLKIFQVCRLGALQKWDVTELECKMVCFPIAVNPSSYDNIDVSSSNYLCIPLIHSEA